MTLVLVQTPAIFKILAEHKENQTVFTPAPTSNTPIINILVSFSFLSLLGEHHFQAHGWVSYVGILIPLFPLSFSPISGRRSGNVSEFCDLQEVTSLDFSVFIHRMGTVRTDESPHGAPESHSSGVSQGCCQWSSGSWGQAWCEWLEQSGSQRGPSSVAREGGGDRETGTRTALSLSGLPVTNLLAAEWGPDTFPQVSGHDCSLPIGPESINWEGGCREQAAWDVKSLLA